MPPKVALADVPAGLQEALRKQKQQQQHASGSKKALLSMFEVGPADYVWVAVVVLLGLYIVPRTSSLVEPVVLLSHNLTDPVVVNATGGAMLYAAGGGDALFVVFAAMLAVLARDALGEIMSRVGRAVSLEKPKQALVSAATTEGVVMLGAAYVLLGELRALGVFAHPAALIATAAMSTTEKATLLFILGYWLHVPVAAYLFEARSAILATAARSAGHFAVFALIYCFGYVHVASALAVVHGVTLGEASLRVTAALLNEKISGKKTGASGKTPLVVSFAKGLAALSAKVKLLQYHTLVLAPAIAAFVFLYALPSSVEASADPYRLPAFGAVVAGSLAFTLASRS